MMKLANGRDRPIISVVVPTRNRPDTLESCLASLRHHKSQAIEIVVQDNFSGPETLQVVEAAQRLDSRVRYSRTPYPTSQRHNFELGLEASTGDYMTIIGDDDGYVLGSLDWLAGHLLKNPADAVRWRLVHYAWPSLSTDGEGFVRIYSSHYYGGWAKQSAKNIADLTFSAQNGGSWENILVYHGMISRRLYDRMRAFTGGTYFHYPLPDVYAHNLIASFCNQLLQVNNPVSIYGTSGHSAGSSWARVTKAKGKQASAGQQWINESRADPIAELVDWQPEIRTLRYHDYQVLKFAKSKGMLGNQPIDRNVWINAIIKEIRTNPWSYGPWLTATERASDDKEVFVAVRAACADIANEVHETPGSHYPPSYEETLLRVRYSNKGWKDDIEGAMLVLHDLMNDGEPLFDGEHEDSLPDLKRRVAKFAYFSAKKMVATYPGVARVAAKRPFVPAALYRYGQRKLSAETERARNMVDRLGGLFVANKREQPVETAKPVKRQRVKKKPQLSV